ncbi:hypothetical protein GUITHDRAFT_156527 [Guillardia theta CCMP2712]|uniref:Uncharacterized protein n=3 Tax=Guillardia theta TaxID=55529 RepID=L1I5U5_GUITC|nr:hypothetical protein GUITHDRAFT_156527 [Guillardia theta CCMP2712]EKX31616.1 hypothetical protein GUITHDRAFT_156527 [Guillardia theta CCMP2712]|mmetsp:Transcript_36703/g.114602  ORF Transcript_36703/g.114602 Transcript_36703/m.114602 type:complete len:237 (+) Transcript_36703:47-757(+)|eukprot:XP_005818596.1 hypothetical protein GUITHDRAFT_156527 [Guillardia theta CCMP2712]
MADDAGQPLRASGELQKQLLAQEIVKLRREVALLRASSVPPEASKHDEEAVKKLREEIETLQSLKEQTIKNANVQKAVLNKEILTLRSELQAIKEENGFHDLDLNEMRAMEAPETQKEIANSLFQRKLFEENFTRVIRDLRKELEQNDLKKLSQTYLASNIQTTIQISNERIEKVMEEAAQVPVESRLHVEALRILMENAKLRKVLNDYSSGVLRNTMVKMKEGETSQSFGSLLGL